MPKIAWPEGITAEAIDTAKRHIRLSYIAPAWCDVCGSFIEASELLGCSGCDKRECDNCYKPHNENEAMRWDVTSEQWWLEK